MTDIDALREKAHALVAEAADRAAFDEPVALLRDALRLAAAEPANRRAVLHADLADMLTARFAATEATPELDEVAFADRDAAIEHWRQAMHEATEAGLCDELVLDSPETVLDHVELLIGRAAATDHADAVELLERFVGLLPDDDPDREEALFRLGFCHALVFDRTPAETAPPARGHRPFP